MLGMVEIDFGARARDMPKGEKGKKMANTQKSAGKKKKCQEIPRKLYAVSFWKDVAGP